MKIKCCYKCEGRYVGCHSKCEKYKNEREKLDNVKAKFKREREAGLLLRVGALNGSSKQALKKKNNF